MRGTCKGLTAALLVVLLSGCSAQAEQPTRPAPDGPQTVIVERRTVTSVVVLDGRVVPSPELVLAAPTTGVFTMRAGLEPGHVFVAGESFGDVDGAPLSVPYAGVLREVVAGAGQHVVANLPLFVVSYSGFGISAQVPPKDLFRMYSEPPGATVNIESGPAGVPCELAHPPATQGSDGANILCLLPPDTNAFPGLSAKLGLKTGSSEDVLSLPLSAVSGRAGQGEVTLISASGERSLVTVGLGISDGSYLEVTSGVVEGDTVVNSAPGFR